MRKRFSLFLAALFLLLVGLSPSAPASGSPARVVAIGAPAVEMLCALGLEDRLIARSSWETFPPSILDLPEVGSPYQPDLERLLLLKPDLVILDGRLGLLAGQMERCGIEVLPVEAYNPDEVVPAVRMLAARFDCRERGEELAGDLLRIAEATARIVRRVPEEERAAGLMFTGLFDMYCVAPESGCTLLENAGAVNLAAGMGQPFPLISLEWLAFHAPDFLLVPQKLSEGAERKREEAGRRLSRALSGRARLIFMEEELTFGLRSFLGALRLAAELYPELIRPDAVEAEQARFMNRYFPKALEKAVP